MKIINNSKRYSILDINSDDLAAQFTLIDLPIFKSIKRDELISLGARSSSEKHCSSPNVVAMNRQFNQVTFWVVGQILSHESARLRAELISYFIKTAKRLNQLNNLHSSYAIVSALLSSPIYRLEKSWSILRKKYLKDKLQLDQLVQLYSDNNNYELLRNHLNNCNLPCIPYLGMYSRDIIYINEAYQTNTSHHQQRQCLEDTDGGRSSSGSSSSGGGGSDKTIASNNHNQLLWKDKNTNKILDSIEKFQLSEYNQLVYIPTINNCLLSNRYLDELQKFVEDENYRRSLELEPPISTSN